MQNSTDGHPDVLQSPGQRACHLAAMACSSLMGFFLYLGFLILLWLRPIVLGLLRVVGGLTLVAGVISFFATPAGSGHIVWIIGGTSFAAFVMAWFYDWLLLKIAPEPIRLFN